MLRITIIRLRAIRRQFQLLPTKGRRILSTALWIITTTAVLTWAAVKFTLRMMMGALILFVMFRIATDSHFKPLSLSVATQLGYDTATALKWLVHQPIVIRLVGL